MFSLGLQLHKRFCRLFYQPPTTLLGKISFWVLSFWCKCGTLNDLEQIPASGVPKTSYTNLYFSTTERKTSAEHEMDFLRFEPAEPIAVKIMVNSVRAWLLRQMIQRRINNRWKRPIVYQIFSEHMRVATNCIALQSIARRYLSLQAYLRSKENLECLTIYMSKSADALTSICRRALARMKYEKLKLQDLQEKLRQEKEAALVTAFPRLGKEHLDGCDCWLIDPSRTILLPRNLLQFCFGRRTMTEPRLLVGSIPRWLLLQRPNQVAIILVRTLDTYTIYKCTDCHLQEGELSWQLGHSAEEILMVRVQSEFKVLFHRPNDFTLDHQEIQLDQHVHRSLIRGSNGFSRFASTSTSAPQPEMVLSNGVLMTRTEKVATRKARKKNKGSGIQTPYRFRALSTDEYHKAVKDEIEFAKPLLGFPLSDQEVSVWIEAHSYYNTNNHLATSCMIKFRDVLAERGLPNICGFSEVLVKYLEEATNKGKTREKQKKEEKLKKNNPDRYRIRQQVLSDRAVATRTDGWADLEEDDLPGLDF